MIRISSIKPLGGSPKDIADIKDDFLKRVKTNYNPEDEISKAIAQNKIEIKDGSTSAKIYPLNRLEKALLQYLFDNFDSLITSTPLEIVTHRNAIQNDLIGKTENTRYGPKFKISDFGKHLFSLFGYDNHFRTKSKKGLWLSKQLNIKACPYCNSQYTLFIKKDDGTEKAKFQFDHFYSKRRYPYLSISLYNLIPSCACCNLNKGDTDVQLGTHYHPYHLNMAELSRFKAEVPLKIEELSIGDVMGLNIPITFEAKYAEYAKLIETHNELFDIADCYCRHTDIVQELLFKAIVNNSSFKNDVMNIRGLFNGDDSLYYRYLISNYTKEGEILERPLSKFTQDIAEQFELIRVPTPI